MADATGTPPGHPEEARVGSGTVPTSVEGELPDGLLEAFDAYERALAADDQAALAAAFEPTATVMRADAGGLLVGHDAITAFRARRGSGPVRRVVECHVQVVTADVAIVVSVNAPAAGGRGVVTQLWRRDPDAGPGVPAPGGSPRPRYRRRRRRSTAGSGGSWASRSSREAEGTTRPARRLLPSRARRSP
ncbi:AtzH-like domain-containing protein [Frigoribacterium sp. SL97]|uniref:AtzH-like domain-containing protein n=1 Tax=Frigoribacterium sp. SL97 TaxID=2994664 RepID=UPI002270BEBE|nr:AtzH-like domain-containing protein [Frigoribacterium sp. SL97]WAC52258.1 DUF3225 domain-containing protein [Frigoribacterium sp. SL97]